MPNHPQILEFLFGGVSTCGAAVFTNPLEVVKTRMQLQGELMAKGQFQVHYRNVFHAFFTVARHEGVCALQKGICPAMTYQFIMNGFRLGSFQLLNDSGLFRASDGKTPFFGSVLCGAMAGSIGGFFGSPIYMVGSLSKTDHICTNLTVLLLFCDVSHYYLAWGLRYDN